MLLRVEVFVGLLTLMDYGSVWITVPGVFVFIVMLLWVCYGLRVYYMIGSCGVLISRVCGVVLMVDDWCDGLIMVWI